MDTTSSSPHLSFNESFSYAWLSDSARGDDDVVVVSGGGGGSSSFIEMDPDFFSMRWSADSKHFDLNLTPSRSVDASLLSRSQSACSTKPLMTISSQRSSPLFLSAQSTPTSAGSAKRSSTNRAFFFRRCAKSPKKILWKYLCFLLPLCRKAKDQLHALAPKPARGACSATAKKASSTFSSIEWCRGNADSAVYDAILYCKRSIGQDIMEK
uniref:Membrane-associated kinase regulator 6 n=1 Tax=Ananas comosus var. bracteatus TaxID=296719 RepID=A0A6V7PX15_ANACO|nr:unnamed protein product [Ananas comosus var. bracteatus]